MQDVFFRHKSHTTINTILIVIAANKAAFYRAFNGIFGKIGRNTSEEVQFELITTKGLSVLYYGTEACPTNSSSKHSFKFTINRVLFKIFGVLSKDSISDICYYFG